MSFEWQTDQEVDLEASSGDEKGSGWRPRPPLWLLLFLLAALIGVSLWRLAKARVATTTSTLAADVRSSHELAAEAVRRQDSELFVPLLSVRDPQWAEAQQRLFTESLIFGQGVARFVQGAPLDSQIAEITFSPDFREAFVTLNHTVLVTESGGLEQSVTMEQPLVYRQGTQRWLLSPPSGEYWGPWLKDSGRIVSLTYPQRDREVARDLLPFIDARLQELCDQLIQPCPPEMELQVLLETDPASLLQTARGELRPAQEIRVTVPTPTLLGLPAGQKARGALYRAYTAHIATAAGAYLTGYRCCQGLLFLESLYDRWLEERGLQPQRTLPLSHYDAMADDLIGLQRLNQLWWEIRRRPPTDLERLQVRLFMDFLRHRSGSTGRDLLQGVVDASGFWKWLENSSKFDPVSQRDALEEAWRDFALGRANAAASGPLPPLPQQDLNLICEDERGQRGLYRYDPGTDEWALESEVDGIFLTLAPTPDDAGIMLVDQGAGGSASERQPTRLWLHGQEMPLPPDLVPAYTLPVDPQGQYASMWRLSGRRVIADEVVLLDLQQCLPGSGCPLKSVPGFPYWSPGGFRLLLARSGDGRLLQTTREIDDLVDSGATQFRSPFWLDDETYGYISGGDQKIQVRPFSRAAGTGPRELLSLHAVLEALGVAEAEQPWIFESVWRVPAKDAAIVGVVSSPQRGAQHFFLAQFQEPSSEPLIRPLLVTTQVLVPRADTLFSPDGRWFALHLSRRPALDIRLVLRDLQRDELLLDVETGGFDALRAHDWSFDGAWLARIGRHFIQLMAPSAGKNARRFVSSGLLQCSSLAWVDK